MGFSILFSAKGRRSRQDFLFIIVFLSMLGYITNHFPALNKLYGPHIIVGYMAFTNLVKRMHDLNHSGYWIGAIYISAFILTGLMEYQKIVNPQDIYVPTGFVLILFCVHLIVSGILFLFLVFKKGTNGENKYGPDPLHTGLQ